MKTSSSSREREDGLSGTLREWVVDTPLPSHFQTRVWDRIARVDGAVNSSSWATFSIRWLTAILHRPSFACSAAVVLFVVGLAAGSWAARMESAQMRSDLGQRYLQAVNPFQQAVASR